MLIMHNNIELVRLLIERGYNQGDLSVADEICAVEFTEHEYLSPVALSGPEIIKNQIREARSHLAGLRTTIEDIAANGDKVWVQLVLRGIDLRSGREIAMSEIDVCRFQNGKMVEHWGIPDRFAMLHQLGRIPDAGCWSEPATTVGHWPATCAML